MVAGSGAAPAWICLVSNDHLSAAVDSGVVSSAVMMLLSGRSATTGNRHWKRLTPARIGRWEGWNGWQHAGMADAVREKSVG